jgi:outer membrane biosynthesis protein TonB
VTAPADGSVRVSTAGSAFNTVLAAYTGDALATLSAVAGNDDAGTARTSEVTFPVTKDTTYRIAVDAFNDREGPLQGAVKLGLELTPAPAPQPTVEDPPAEDPPADDPPTQDPPKTDPPTQDPPKIDPPVQDPPKTDPPKVDPPVQDPAKTDPPTQDATTKAVPPDTEERAGDDTQAQVQAAPEVRTARSSTPAPRPPAPGTGPAPVAPLSVAATTSRLKLAAVSRGGVLGAAQCSRACRISATLTPAGRTRGRAASRTAVQALGANADGTRFTLRLTPAARKALRAGRLVVVLTATAADGATATTRRTVTLTR